jgi:hypothetical protein
MKKFIKENWFKIIIIVILCLFSALYSANGIKRQTSGKDIEVKKSFTSNDISLATQITCTYPRILNTSYNNGEISHMLPKPETNAMIFTFSELNNPKAGKLSYIDATRTITNVELIKLIDNENKLVYVEGTGENYLTVHTIYKKSGVATFAKNVEIFWIPSASLAMGSCVGY